MGFGSAWLLQSLLATDLEFSYVGLDGTEEFVDRASKLFSNTTAATFLVGDLETDLTLPVMADVVVNAFNFFELCDLPRAMHNVKKHLRPGGSLFMSTIDKTYLLLALSKSWPEFHENLRRYQQLPGTKYAFQAIDVGTHLSDLLEYPSVLYSTQDFVDAAASEGLRLISYVEHPFTARAVPKIYCHLEFQHCESLRSDSVGLDG
jgi:SAM-dependent methyltransferase